MRKSIWNISERQIRRLAEQEANMIIDSHFESLPDEKPQYSSTVVNCEQIGKQVLTDMEVDRCGAMEEEEEHNNRDVEEWDKVEEKKQEEEIEEEKWEYEEMTADEDHRINEVNEDLAQDTLTEDESDDNIRERDNLKEFLANWSVQFNISHVALKSLLKKLKEYPVHENLPLDPRSLLSTPRNIKIRNVLPEKYCHVSLSKGIKSIVSRMSTMPEGLIKISINIDGLPLSKSSQKQLWPILGSVKPFKNVFVIGIYYGEEKPKDVNNFLKNFVTEAKHLCTEGICIKGIQLQCTIDSLICDMPAKSFVLCTKGHSGYSSCSSCIVEGEYINGRVCFPQIRAAKRTDDDFRNKVDDEYHNLGITSCLVEIPSFDPVTNVPTDPMHLLYLGIMRRMLYLLINGDLQYRLPNVEVERISFHLNEIAPYIPVEFARKPRSLKFIKLWKATEFRQILLYTGPVALRLLRRDIYNHFVTLHVAVRIMSDEKLHDLLDYAQELMEHFISSFQLL
ncbi:uncharacterized protein LOC118644365 [Monomorium pharaonis]|uniref:uncharacterized protein LOC118644365 n=1 Tax=Monomorium pharaonis TaxID=307658 RepID=UPI0017468786|nr:uncharacterized protein LOC118644365 [Monomorium pharaonis]XP_036138681.1 uncharacterized protein LOC118644365 [Monomorium pharaonis]XP_036138682.1 uncharacterized protein LOC118644365 [Monomorium pharaonis]